MGSISLILVVGSIIAVVNHSYKRVTRLIQGVNLRTVHKSNNTT